MDWQDISTAPKDGTVIDLWGVNHNISATDPPKRKRPKGKSP